jgi:hypothetical protein
MPTPPELTKLTKLLRKPIWDGKKMDGKAITSALLVVREGYSTFYEPLDHVAEMVEEVFPKKKALRASLKAIAQDWDDDTRDTFLLVAGYATQRRIRNAAPSENLRNDALVASTRDLAAAVGLPKNAAVRMKLSAWGLSSEKAPKLPKELPSTVDAALALHAELGLTKDILSLGKPACPDKDAPKPLARFHLEHATLGSRTIVAPNKLAAATKNLRQWVKLALPELQHEDVDRGTLHPSKLSERAAGFGTASGGDVYFLDPGLDLGSEDLPVLRFVHDEGHAEVEASSFGAFVGAHVLKAAFGGGPSEEALERLITRDRKRVKVPAALAKAPPSDDNDD